VALRLIGREVWVCSDDTGELLHVLARIADHLTVAEWEWLYGDESRLPPELGGEE
jgi:hypothetical protein